MANVEIFLSSEVWIQNFSLSAAKQSTKQENGKVTSVSIEAIPEKENILSSQVVHVSTSL